jgi:hypothetical protein
MSPLDPNLKRLLMHSRRALTEQDQLPNEAPFGFASRVVGAWSPASPVSVLSDLQRHARLSSCLAVVVIVIGGAVFLGWTRAPHPASGLPTALSFAANQLSP